MKFNDDITLDIAKAVSDVLEGKVNIKEEMDPTDHVMKSDEGKYCVYNPAGKKVAEFDTKDEADKYAIDNHKKIMAKEVAEPEPKGEKDFKDKHVKKVSGMKNDGTNIKETKADIEAEYAAELSKINEAQSAAQKAAFKKMLDAKDKAEDKDSKKEAKEEETPTGPTDEETEKQKKYQAFFSKALKKFGVKSPSELEGDKKKDFFDYVDANYEADDEVEEGQVDEILGTIKKVAQKVKDKVVGKKPEPKSTKSKNPFDSPDYIKAQIKIAKGKLRDAQTSLKKATADDNEKGMDHWGEVELNRMSSIKNLEAKLKDLK
jgi:hypothetical protein